MELKFTYYLDFKPRYFFVSKIWSWSLRIINSTKNICVRNYYVLTHKCIFKTVPTNDFKMEILCILLEVNVRFFLIKQSDNKIKSTYLPGGTEGYPAQPGLIRPSVCLSVHACRLGIERKMAQAQQIRSIILQNHESTWIVNQKFFEIKYINERKHSK